MAKKYKHSFSCCIIGSDSLVIQCAENLLRAHHVILGIISNNTEVRNWAKEHQIFCEEDFTHLLSKQFDYLFSIVNDKVLPATFLKTPRYFSINYHDALLPKYAGTHATSWALLNGERQHGITWHVMNEIVDGGDILKQVAFDIDDNETTLSLNLKCYEHAIQSFTELIDELAKRNYQRKPQDLTERTYYATHQKPIGNGWISWHQSASAINRLCRALTFGPYPNRLSTAKCILNNEGYIIADTFLLKKASQHPPGTVIKINQDYLQIATTSFDIAISKLLTLKGELCSIKEVCQQNSIKEGSQLISPSESESLTFIEKSKQCSKNENFWLQKLENFKPAELPFLSKSKSDSSWPQSFCGTVILDIETCQKMNASLQGQATISEILLTIWLIYLYRLNNQEHLGVGFTANKFFVSDYFISNQLPLSLQFNDDMNFVDCLRMVKKQLLLCRENNCFLMDIYQRYPYLENHIKQYPINVAIVDNIEESQIINTSLVNVLISEAANSISIFSQKKINENFKITLKNISGHLETLLNTVVENPNQKISYLSLLTAAECQQILIDWNRTEADFPRDKTVHRLFEEQAERTPTNVAVIFEGQQLTYKELNERANQLAHYLMKLGVKPETLVGICIERSLEMIIGILAILKAGGAYVPIDPEYPQARVQYILKDCQAPFVITSRFLAQRLKEISSSLTKIVLLDEDVLKIIHEPVKNPKNLSIVNNLMYVIYTSGSTGNPKGVMIEHVSVVNFLLGAEQALPVNASDNVLAITSFCFDISVLEFWLPLIIGAKCVIAAIDIVKDVESLQNLLKKNSITLMQATPSLWQVLFESGWENKTNIKILCGGEALNYQLANKFLLTASTAHNLYGPTEATIWSTLNNFKEVNQGSLVPIGKPLSNQQAYVLDKNLQPLPVGVSGELYLSGLGLARGYLHQEKLTTDRFIVSKNIASRLYKTGDLVHWLPDGNLQYVGRIDNQIKVRGYRMELEEIEYALLKHPDVSQTVVVLVQEQEIHNDLLVFYVVKEEALEKRLSSQKIRTFLRTILPEYMIPNFFVQVKNIPITPNGKVDRKKLLALNPNYQSENSVNALIEQLTDEEKLLVSIWCDVFKLNQICINDNFFELGGDSIRAMQIVTKARDMGFQLNIKDIFLCPTIAELCKFSRKVFYKQSSTKLDKSFSKKDAAKLSQDKYPLSPVQKGLFFHTLCSPESGVYIIQLNWQIKNFLNVKLFFEALKILTDRHDVLRTCFNFYDSEEPLQVVKPEHIIAGQQYDWQMLTKSKQTNRLQNFLEEDRYAGFDFNDVPIRLTLIKLSKRLYQVILSVHHILMDGWSLAILIEELNTIYLNLYQNKQPYLSKFPQFVNYIHWLQQQDLKAAKNFWQKYLSGFKTPAEIFISRYSSEQEKSHKPNYKIGYKALSSSLVRKLQKFSQLNKLTLNTLFQGAWAGILARYSQMDDIVFGITMSGRPTQLKNSEQMVGIFINTLPLRVQFSNDLPIKRCLQKIQDDVLEMATYHYTSLKDIEEWSEIAGNNLFKSIFVFENYPKNNRKEEIVNFNDIEIIDPTHYPLAISVIPGEKIILKYCYNKHVIHTELMTNLIKHFEIFLDEMVSNSEKSFSQVNLLTFMERQKILVDWNRTEKDFPRDMAIHQLFEKQVQKNPRAVALAFENERLQYGELNKRANQLAHFFKKLKVKPGTLIGIFAERTPEIVIGILGILKAGGVYVPIDLTMPSERIRDVLQNYPINIILSNQDFDSKIKNLFKELKIITYRMDKQFETFRTQGFNDLGLKIDGNDLAYIIFTSGSTGVPKAIAQSHKTIVNLISWQSNLSNFGVKVTQFANTSFDVSIQEIFYALLNGYELYIIPSTMKKSIPDFINLIQTEKINEIFIPTALLDIFTNEAILMKLELNFLVSITVAGEALKITNSIREFFTHYKNIKLINHYGPSETHVVTCFRLPSNPQIWPEFPSIGRPIANTKAYILDKYMQPLPPDCIGELYFSGPGIAQGYFYQPELTQKKFVYNPFNSNSILYKTGDLAYWTLDGNINYVGRIDNQIKINGFRIELGEIEMQIQKSPEIKQAVVKVHETSNNKYLVAYLLIKDNKIKDIPKLKNFLRKFLPSYMIPTAFIFLKKFPLTPNGKIDKKALPDPQRIQLAIPKICIGARNSVEENLVLIWQEVLSIRDIGIQDDFFELGGHSLTALQVLLRIRKHFHIDLPMRALLDAPTVAQLAEVVEQKRFDNVVLMEAMNQNSNNHLLSSLVPLKPTGNKTPLFLIHPIGGTVFWYVPLVKYLDSDQPLYGIQDPGVEGNMNSFETVEEMASFYIRIIRSVQSHGPYVLGGASAGATISFEIARQLLNQGEQIAFLGLLDGWVHHPEEVNNRELFEAVMRRQYNQVQEKFIVKGIVRVEKLLKLQWQRVQMLLKYNVPCIESKLTLFKALDTADSIYQPYEAPVNHWEKHSTKIVEVHLIPGDHETIFQEPNIQMLAQKMNDCLRKLPKRMRLMSETIRFDVKKHIEKKIIKHNYII